MSYKIEIPFFIPNGNDVKRMPHWKYAQLRETIRSLMLRYFMENGSPRLRGKGKITFMRSYKGRKQDYDNLVACGKPVFDALMSLSVIEDDSPDHIDREYRQEESKEHYFTVLIERKTPEV